MEEPQPPTPQILPQTDQPPTPVQQPVSLVVVPTSSKRKLLIPAIVILVVILLILAIFSRVSTPGQPGSSSNSLSSTPTPTGFSVTNRLLSSFATESAFLQFESSVEALPKLIQGAVLQDQTVLPPVIDLPLGF